MLRSWCLLTGYIFASDGHHAQPAPEAARQLAAQPLADSKAAPIAADERYYGRGATRFVDGGKPAGRPVCLNTCATVSTRPPRGAALSVRRAHAHQPAARAHLCMTQLTPQAGDGVCNDGRFKRGEKPTDAVRLVRDCGAASCARSSCTGPVLLSRPGGSVLTPLQRLRVATPAQVSCDLGTDCQDCGPWTPSGHAPWCAARGRGCPFMLRVRARRFSNECCSPHVRAGSRMRSQDLWPASRKPKCRCARVRTPRLALHCF